MRPNGDEEVDDVLVADRVADVATVSAALDHAVEAKNSELLRYDAWRQLGEFGQFLDRLLRTEQRVEQPDPAARSECRHDIGDSVGLIRIQRS